MDIWHDASNNWSELCALMGCARIRVSGAVAHTYLIERSGTFYNFVIVQDPSSFVIEEVEDVYAKQKLPFAIRIPKLVTYTDLETSLCNRGYSVAPAWVLMTQSECKSYEANPEVEIDEIDRSRMVEWCELQNAFSQTLSTKAVREEMIRRILGDKSVHLLMASLNHRPVGTGLLFLKDDVASIHLIATQFEFRRRHVASTLTIEAIRRTKSEKINLIWLRTRKGGVGEKVYTKIGFHFFTDILSYTKTPELEDSNLPTPRPA
jgi:hypothetical protein